MALSKILLPDGVTELANVKSVTFKEAVNSGVDLRPGCVGSASIEVEVFNTQPNAVSAGDALTYYQIDKNNTQTLIGVFYAEPLIATKNSYKFIAYDAAQKLNADFSTWLMANQSNFPMTIYALVSAACTVAGVTLGSVSWPLSTENVEAFYADGLSCRDILSYAAELGCKFVRCHSDGHVYFDWYATASNKRIYPSAGTSGSETRYAYKQDGLQYANYTTAAIDGVAVHPSGEDDVAYIYPTSASGNLLNITNNLLLTGADASLYNAAAQAIYTALNTLGTYRPVTANLFPRENPFRAGDVVAVTDAQAVSFTTVIMEQTVNESDAVLSSTGNEYYSEDGNTQKALTQLASDVVRINKLKVDWADINTAIINYLTANDVTAQNLTIVDANDNVLATFNASGIVLGNSNQTHAELDFNSFELITKNGISYLSVGDFSGSDGYSHITQEFTISSATNSVLLYTVPNAIDSIYVNGTLLDSNDYSFYNNSVNFTQTLSANDDVVVNYRVSGLYSHYDLGTRKISTQIAPWSFITGSNQEASGVYSASVGGTENKAKGFYSIICGGSFNIASGDSSSVIGGSSNETRKQDSFIGGGNDNLADGEYSSLIGGYHNQVNYVNALQSGRNCAIVGGWDNSVASGEAVIIGGKENSIYGISSGNSVILGGYGNISNNGHQIVYGKYNSPGNYIEIAGNGTADNARSNARTLDWSGNEWIAGALSVGDAATTRANLGDIYGAQVNITSGSHDLNSYTTAGLYYFKSGTTLTNSPFSSADGWLTVYVSSNGTYIKQVFQREGNVSGTYKGFYLRLCGNGTWGAWVRLLHTDDLPLSISNIGCVTEVVTMPQLSLPASGTAHD